MTDLIDTVQELEIDDAYIELFDIRLKYVNSSGNLDTTQVYHLIDGLEDGTTNLWMPYDTNDNGSLEWAEYIALPIAIEGVSTSSDGAQGRPTLSLANVAALARSVSADDDGIDDEIAFSGGASDASVYSILEELNISKNEDVLGSVVLHRKTLLKNTYVYDSGNHYTYEDRITKATPIDPVPLPKEFPSGRYILDRVAAENQIIVQFELASPFDIQGLKVPNRYIIGKYCPWEYKGLVDGSVKSGCSWENNGVGAVTTSTLTGATDGEYIINEASPGVTLNTTASSPPSGWTLKIEIDSNTVLVTISRPGSSFEFNDTIVVSSSIIGGSEDLTLTVVNRVNFDIDNNNTNSTGDVCGKTIQSCKARFNFGDAEKDVPLPFGGFPGSRKFR